MFRCLLPSVYQVMFMEHQDQILVGTMLVVVEMVVDIHLLETLLLKQLNQLVVVDMVSWMRIFQYILVLVDMD